MLPWYHRPECQTLWSRSCIGNECQRYKVASSGGTTCRNVKVAAWQALGISMCLVQRQELLDRRWRLPDGRSYPNVVYGNYL